MMMSCWWVVGGSRIAKCYDFYPTLFWSKLADVGCWIVYTVGCCLVQVAVRELISGMGAPLAGMGEGTKWEWWNVFKGSKEFLLIQSFLSGDASVE